MNKGVLVLIITTLIIAILLNFIIPHIVLPLATDEEKKTGDDLGVKGNFMRLMAYNSANPLSSTIYLLIIVFVSIYLGQMIKIKESIIKSVNNINNKNIKNIKNN